MNDNFENNFENEPEMPEASEAFEAPEVPEMQEAQEFPQEDAWEEEPEEKLYDDMEDAFREEDASAMYGDENTTEVFDKYPDIPAEPAYTNGKSTKIVVAVLVAVFVAVIVIIGVIGIMMFGGKFKSSDMGAGNISNMSFMTVSGDHTYYIEPTTYALCRFTDSPVSAELATADPENNPALFLTDIDGSLYYVSMLNGCFMRYVDGMNDEVVISGQCYYPTYVDGTLYYLSLTDYLVYAVPVTGGTFGEATPVTQTQAYYLNIYENTLYYIDAVEQMLYAMPLDGSADPVQVSTSQMSYINIADGYIYFMRYPDEAQTVSPALCRISVKDYSTEEVIVDNSYCIYNNYADGYIYYMSYVPTEDEEAAASMVYPLYCVKADGSEAPYQVSPEQGLYIHIIDGYVYYLTLSENNVATWKRLPLGAIDEDGTKAEILPGQELLPLTDEPFALEDLLGEENTGETEAEPEEAVETEE